MGIMDRAIAGGVSFGRNFVGIVTRPYETYRRIIDRGSMWELPYIGILLAAYFAIAALVKTAAFRPFFLTEQFISLALCVGITFLLVAGLLWIVARAVGGVGRIQPFLLGWGYTLIPTLVWFLATSLLFVLLPPPRRITPEGIAFSIVYLVFSAVLLFWKVTLGYLTLRFGMKLDLVKICIVLIICLPIIVLFSIITYRFGIFKVPFL